MAGKSFLTIEEAAQRLGKSTSEVNALADKGLLQRVMHEGVAKFRVEQVDLLAKADDSSAGEFKMLDESGAPIGLADSGGGSAIAPAKGAAKSASPLDDSVLGLADSGGMSPEKTGISALTGKTRAGDAVEIGMETVGSGSGLLDLTRESEETALGAELMEQAFSNEDAGASAVGASGLFDATGSDAGGAGSSPVVGAGMMVPEAYDGGWSGLTVGVMIAGMAAMVVVALVALGAATGGGSSVGSIFTGNLMAWAGGLAGITAVFGLVGFFVGRASE
jgi:hypothetical protein